MSSGWFRDNAIMIVVIVVIFIILLFISHFSNAQTQRGPALLGLEVSFGVKSYTISSDISEISQLPVDLEGGSLGFAFGNSTLRTRIMLAGFYYSQSTVRRTISQFTPAMTFCYYPFELTAAQHVTFSLYLLSGGSYYDVRFFGHYLDSPGQNINYSTTVEPYIGSVRSAIGLIGTGVEYSKQIEFGFVQVFAETTYGQPLILATNKQALNRTTFTNPLTIQIGVRFGRVRDGTQPLD